MAFKYFVIFGAMRTGSNLLERSLDAYEGLTGLGELFNPHFIGKPQRREFLATPIGERNADPIGFLQKVIDATEGAPGFRIFDSHDRRVIDHAARDPSCAKILLTRTPIDSFISLEIAQSTGQWMLMKDENRRLAKMRFEPEKYERYLANRTAHYERIRRAAQEAGQALFEVDYDDLTDIAVLNGAAAYVGSAERKSTLPDKIQRQNPQAWADKVENVAELEAYAAGRFSSPDPDPEPAVRFGALGEMAASKNFEAIYAPIPGAGAAEFRRLLTDAAAEAGAEEPRLAAGMKEKHLVRRRARGSFVFSVIRHPATRIWDVYLRRILKAEAGIYAAAQTAMSRDHRAPSPSEMADGGDGMLAGFDAFLSFVEDNLAGRTAVRVDPAWTPQSTLLAEYARETPMDFVGRVERLEEDAAYILQRIGAAETDVVDRLNAAFARVDAVMPREQWLSPEREARIRTLYARDYARLGYGAAP